MPFGQMYNHLCRSWFSSFLLFNGLLKGISQISLWEAPNSCAIIDCKGMLSVFVSNIEDYLLKYGADKTGEPSEDK